MTDGKKDPMTSEPPGGMSAEHSFKTRTTHFVAPSTAEKEILNVIKLEVQTVACWKVEDICFDFDQAFVRKETKIQIKKLADLYKKLTGLFERHPAYKSNPRPPLSIFGHADPVGKDPYNKTLSENRAKAIYGVLTRKVETWKEIFKTEKHVKALQEGLKKAGHDPGSINGVMSSQTENAIAAYMDELGGDFKMEEADFLAGGNCPFQGCSEFNPVLMFSKKEWEDFRKAKDKTKRDAENQPNRRVVAYLFKPGTKVVPSLWPCPKAPEIQGCIDRFWLKGKERRLFQADRREHSKTQDTFACRFYERLTRLSPCENVVRIKPTVRLRFAETSHQFSMPLRYIQKEVEGELRTFMEWIDGAGHRHTVSSGFFDHFTVDLERSEVNEQGSVVAKDETHLVKSHFQAVKRGSETWYILTAVVVDGQTQKELFKGKIEARDMFDKGGTWVRSGGGGGWEVWRKVQDVKGGAGVYDPRQGKVVSYETLERKEVKSEPGIMEKMEKGLYPELCGGFDNITKRVEDLTAKAWTEEMEATLRNQP